MTSQVQEPEEPLRQARGQKRAAPLSTPEDPDQVAEMILETLKKAHVVFTERLMICGSALIKTAELLQDGFEQKLNERELETPLKVQKDLQEHANRVTKVLIGIHKSHDVARVLAEAERCGQEAVVKDLAANLNQSLKKLRADREALSGSESWQAPLQHFAARVQKRRSLKISCLMLSEAALSASARCKCRCWCKVEAFLKS